MILIKKLLINISVSGHFIIIRMGKFFSWEKKFNYLEKCSLTNKLTFLNLLDEIKVSLWLESFFDSSMIKRKKNLCILIDDFNAETFSLFFSFVSGKTDLNSFRVNKFSHRDRKNYKYYYLLAIDQYIHGRKLGIKFNSFHLKWKKNTWQVIEQAFENLMIMLSIDKNDAEFLFLSIETYRYDLFDKIALLDKKKQKQLLCSVIGTKFFDCPRMRKMWVSFAVNFFNRKKKMCRSLSNNNEIRYLFGTDCFKCFMLKKEKGLKKIFQKLSNFHKIDYFRFLRLVFDDYCNKAIFNPNFFWSKDFVYHLLSLFQKLLTKKIDNDLSSVVSTIDIIENKKMFRIKNFLVDLLPELEVSDTLVKTSAVFSLGILSTTVQHRSFFMEFLIKLDKISNWTKFFVGKFLFILNSETWKNYKNCIDSIKKDSVSDQIKGGLFFGMGIKFKNFFFYEKLIIKIFHEILSRNTDSIALYGASLGLSLSLAQKIRDPIKSCSCRLIMDSINSDIVTGIGYSLSIGLMFLGSSSLFLVKKIASLVSEIEHEKIAKTLILSIGLLFFGKKDKSAIIFNKFFFEKDPVIRTGAVCVQTLAYAQTGNFKIIRNFLKIIASDSDNNVKKASIIGIGVVFYSKFALIKNIMKQLCNHHNPFVRYEVCFAITLSDASTKNNDAIFLLKSLCDDPVDFVRQAAYISLGLMFMNGKNCSKKIALKSFLKNRIKSADGSPFSKFGLILGYCMSESSNRKKKINRTNLNLLEENILSLFLFVQHWSFIPFLSFIKL